MKRTTLPLVTTLLLTSTLVMGDWRSSADEETKIDNLVRAMPNTADLMLLVGARYNNLYWAAKQENWEFAAYQAKELRGLLNKNMITRPGRSEGLQGFLESAYPTIDEAIASADWADFEGAFINLRSACLACHVDSGFSFIGLPVIPPLPNNPALHLAE